MIIQTNLLGNENDLNNLIFLNYYDNNYIPLENMIYSYFPLSNYINLINYDIDKYKNCNIKIIKKTQNISLKFGGIYKINNEQDKILNPSNYKFEFEKGSIIITDIINNIIIQTNKSYPNLINKIPILHKTFDLDEDISNNKVVPNSDIILYTKNYIKGTKSVIFNASTGLSYDINDISNVFSLNFWFYTTTTSTSENILAQHMIIDNNTGWKIYKNLNKLYIKLFSGILLNDNENLIIINDINDNEWYNLGLIVDINLTKVFINGEIKNKNGFKVDYLNNLTSTPIIIGKNISRGSLIDDFRYYNILLDENEIKELYTGKVIITIKGDKNNCDINKGYKEIEDVNNKNIIINLKNEFELILKKLNNNEKPYNYYNIYPLAILILFLWILLLTLLLHILNYYYSNYYTSILILIIIILLIFTSLWFLYVNNILI